MTAMNVQIMTEALSGKTRMRRDFASGYSAHRAGKIRARQIWRVILKPTDAPYYVGVVWSLLDYRLSILMPGFYLARIYAKLMLSHAEASLVEGTSVVIPTTSLLGRKFQFCIRAISHSEMPEEILVFQVNKNFSYSAAINKGIRASTGKYVVVVNDDCFVKGNWLSALVRLAETNPRIGIVGSKLLQVNGKIHPTEGYLDLEGKTILEIRNPELPHVVNGFLGCSILIKRELIDQIGGFDEAFSPYMYEDVDFCYRARLKGWLVYYCPNSEVYHIQGASRRHVSEEVRRQVEEKNMHLFLERWKPLMQDGRI